jgi:oxygen-independent coproporphyrinogen-3 oxidase
MIRITPAPAGEGGRTDESAAGEGGASAGPLPVERYLRPRTLTLGSLPPLSLYVHLPWCLRKCPYCDFNSHEARAEPPYARYLDALRADLEAALPLVWGRRIVSIFIGGGTPSLFAPAHVDALLADIRARLTLVPGCEITLEANPGTFERDRFRGYRDAGVTRLSIGVQSFDDAKLAVLGRVHDARQAREAVREAKDAFETFNVDLMYALPGQTLAELDADLAQALAFEPPHLSVYHLTIEPNTLFASAPPRVPDDDLASEMLDRVVAAAQAAGMTRYEVSAYARLGHRCQHNLNYWEFGDYLGIGAGAHSKLSFPHRVVRQIRFRDPQRYMARALEGNAVAQDEEVSRAQLPFEFMLNALRLRDGFEIARFTERTGLPPNVIGQAVDEAERRGLLWRDLVRMGPTAKGFDFLSDLQALFLPG